MGKIVSKNHEIQIDDHGIVHIKVLEGAHIDSKDLDFVNESTFRLSGRKKVLALVDARDFHTLTPEATSYLKTGVIENARIASAVICNKIAIRIIVDDMNRVQKTKSPIQIFTSEIKAYAWLLAHKKKAAKNKQ